MTGALVPAASGRPGLLAEVARSEAADRLRAEAREYLAARAQRLLTGVGRGLGEATVRLTDIAEGRDPGFARLALAVGRKLADGKGPARAALELAVDRLTDRRGGTAARPLVVVERIDVGVPARTAYDVWARHPRAHPAPGDRIVWTAHGLRGVVSFHPLADDLTRVLLIAEYRPGGPAERAAALVRVPARRARRDLTDFARHITLNAPNGVPVGDSPPSAPLSDRPTAERSRR
ncbi:hypothetical protein [Streptomyces sp. NPDC052610]|uniref:hypothetical protein n=1 Tax=Streptomyces sp. NPDC052610 TaxID=3154952 RepID=UPI00342D1810